MARQDQLPEALIFGSSRVMGIETDQVQSVTGMHTFNYGVFGARPAIYLAQLRYALRLGLRPRLVVLGADEYSFGEKNPLWPMDLQVVGHLGLYCEIPFPENLEFGLPQLKSLRPTSTWHSMLNLLGRARPNREQEFVWRASGTTLEARIGQHAEKWIADHSGNDFVESVRTCVRNEVFSGFSFTC